MIIRNKTRTLPDLWSDADVRELIDHAHDLAMHGNPAGFFLVRDVDMLSTDEIRLWIGEHSDQVLTVWQYQVGRDP